MTDTSPNTPDSLQAQYEAIVHGLDSGTIRIELPGRLDIWLGNNRHLTSTAVAALGRLAEGERPEAFIDEHFPNWETAQWVDAGWFPPVPAEVLTAAGGQYIGLGSPEGKAMDEDGLVATFLDWMRDWKAHEDELACAEEDNQKDDQKEGRAQQQSRSPSFSRHVLGFVAGSAVMLYLTYEALKVFIPTEITQREPIGSLVTAHASGAGSFPWLLETEHGVYPVGRVLMIDKGAPLILVTLSNGKQAVCDVRMAVCARTVGAEHRIALNGSFQ